MADAETRLREVLINIAKEQGYDDPEIDVRPICSGGANYTSQLFAITLSSSEKEDLNLFSKVANLGEKIRTVGNPHVFQVEIIFYTKILIKFKDLEMRNKIAEKERLLLPQYYGGITDFSEELMVFDDFSAQGYQSFNRFKCFDWEYASTCVDVLAKLHALSVAYQKEDPKGYDEILGKLQFNASTKALDAFLNKSIATAVEATDITYRARVETFLHLKKQTFAKYLNPERKIVLIHGDFRPSNILHKVNEDGELQVALVDYQLIKHGNPVTDLIFFLVCGSDEEFRGKHLDRFFDHYYHAFRNSLRRLGIDSEEIYKENDFRDDIKEMLPLGLVLAVLMLPIITAGDDTSSTPKQVTGVNSGRVKPAVSNQFSVRFNALVRDYMQRGIL